MDSVVARRVCRNLQSNAQLHEDDTMDMTICLFLLAGAGFGIITYRFKHLFSEGPCEADASRSDEHFSGRIFWVMVCTFLWPIMVLTGMNSARILIKRRAKKSFDSQ